MTRLFSFSHLPRLFRATSTRRLRHQSIRCALGLVGSFLVAGPVFAIQHSVQHRTFLEDRKKEDQDESSTDTVFDVTKTWRVESSNQESSSSTDFWLKVLSSRTGQSSNTQGTEQMSSTAETASGGTFQAVASGLMSLLKGGNKNSQQKTIVDIVSSIREKVDQGELHDSTSLDETVQILSQYKDVLKGLVEKYASEIDFTKLTPAAIHYYLEYEDERKNPSWKCRSHRFCQGVDIKKIEQMYIALALANLSYVDTVDELKKGLAAGGRPAELVYSQIKSNPGEPAHFIAVPIDQSTSSREPLEVLIGVRGTKSLADAITDALCDAEGYRGGKAHQFILKGGMYLFEKHIALLEDLCKQAGKSKIKLTLVGHSLGAGVASIAGIEFNDLKNFSVEVIGFGCPSLLSKDLAEKSTFITTVVNDSDCIPRTSAATVTNLLLSLVEFNWIPYAKKDVGHALGELQRVNPSIFSEKLAQQIKQTVEPLMDEHLDKLIEKKRLARVPVELFPPGRLIHLYRDGSGVSGSIVPNTFFNEIDLTRRLVDGRLCGSCDSPCYAYE
jgi:hypothetical protein